MEVKTLEKFEIEKFIEEVDEDVIRFYRENPPSGFVYVNLPDNSLLIVSNAVILDENEISTLNETTTVITTTNGRFEQIQVEIPQVFRVKGEILRPSVKGD